MTFGERLASLRKASGQTLQGMADLLGMSAPGYRRLEDGTGAKTYEKLPKIAKKLGCRIDDLFPEMDDVQAAEEGKTECKFGFDGDAQDESLDGWAM